MVVTFRTQQLIKTGKSVTISKKFSFSTRSTSSHFRNYVDKNTVPRSDKEKLRLCDCKRFHSTRESRTTLAKLTPQELFHCGGTESRGVAPYDGSHYADLAISNVFDSALQSRGSSLRQLNDRIAAGSSDVEQIVSGINTELKSDILSIDGDLIKINSENLRTLISDGLRARIRDLLPDNPALVARLETNIKEQLEARSQRLKQIAESNPIEVNAVRTVLERHHRRERQKREVRAGEFNLTQIISELVFNVLHEQLSSIIYEVLNSVKNLLLGFYSEQAPANEIEKVIAFAKNTLIQKAVELITVLQQNIKAIVVPTNNTASGQVARRKRAAGDGSDTAAAADGSNGGSQGGEDSSGGGDVGFGLLDSLVQSLQGVLALITTPLNVLLKLLGNGLLTVLSPLLGSTIVQQLSDAVNPLIDALLPSVV